jgi:hypothetical protein
VKFRPFRKWFNFRVKYEPGFYARFVGLWIQPTMPEGVNIALGLFWWRVDLSCVFGEWENNPGPALAEAERKRMRKYERNRRQS